MIFQLLNSTNVSTLTETLCDRAPFIPVASQYPSCEDETTYIFSHILCAIRYHDDNREKGSLALLHTHNFSLSLLCLPYLHQINQINSHTLMLHWEKKYYFILEFSFQQWRMVAVFSIIIIRFMATNERHDCES